MAAAFARPFAPTFIRPGAASLWFPPRPFPALLWLAQRPASAARTPARSAAVSGGSSPAWAASPTREPAGTEAGATGKPRRRVAGEPPRLNLELRLLFCHSPQAPDEDFFTALRIELGRRAWSLEHAIGAPRPAWSPEPGMESDLEKRRARLVTEVNLGLAMVETAPIRYPRPVRNALLARHAKQIGRCLQELLRHPDAGSISDELTRMFDALQRRY